METNGSRIWRLLTRPVLLTAIGWALTGCATNLNRAITHEKPEAIEKFLAAGADINAPDGHGASPLINAAQYGDLALIRRLVERGAQVNVADHEGNTALMYLAGGEKYKNDAVAFLLAQGARIGDRNHHGLTAVLLAAGRECAPADVDRQTELIALLLRNGADINATTPGGDLPLHLAARAGQPGPALAQLVHESRDPQALNQSGLSAFTEAVSADRLAAATFLASVGFEPQKSPPVASPPPGQSGARPPDRAPGIEARAHDAYGDFLRAKGDHAAALDSYRVSQASYTAAVAEFRRAVDQYTAALKDEKAARQNKWISTIAVNALGAGLGAATGVGFVAVPKTFKNRIDELTDELDRDKAELKALLAEQAAMSAKIVAMESVPKPVSVPAPTPATP
jgi:ankyrin repeat protein